MTGLSPDVVNDLTRAVRAEVETGARQPGADVRAALRRCASRRAELEEFVLRVAGLEPDDRRSFVAAIDDVQVRSKLWLIEAVEAVRPLAGASIAVLGGWYGILPLLMNWRLERPPEQVLCIDIDPSACALGEWVVGSLYPNVAFEVADVMDLDYSRILPDRSAVLINTICEHLPKLAAWWDLVPVGSFTILQSNNYGLCPDHVNWVRGTDEMKKQTPLSRPLFEGTLPLGLFDRFMLIGYR